MDEQARQALFISHANPEDNAFTLWLGAKLTALGYQVFADVLRLRGGDSGNAFLKMLSATRPPNSCSSPHRMAFKSKACVTK